MSTLFSKICQLLNVLFSKISPQNLDFFIDRRRFIDADTVIILIFKLIIFNKLTSMSEAYGMETFSPVLGRCNLPHYHRPRDTAALSD